MAMPTHVLGVDLLKLILRSKDPFPPRFFCHSCKQKFTLPMKSTSPVSTAEIVLSLKPADHSGVLAYGVCKLLAHMYLHSTASCQLYSLFL